MKGEESVVRMTCFNLTPVRSFSLLTIPARPAAELSAIDLAIFATLDKLGWLINKLEECRRRRQGCPAPRREAKHKKVSKNKNQGTTELSAFRQYFFIAGTLRRKVGGDEEQCQRYVVTSVLAA